MGGVEWIPDSTPLHSASLCSSSLYSALPCPCLPHFTPLCPASLHSASLCSSSPNSTLLCSTFLHSTLLSVPLHSTPFQPTVQVLYSFYPTSLHSVPLLSTLLRFALLHQTPLYSALLFSILLYFLPHFTPLLFNLHCILFIPFHSTLLCSVLLPLHFSPCTSLNLTRPNLFYLTLHCSPPLHVLFFTVLFSAPLRSTVLCSYSLFMTCLFNH